MGENIRLSEAITEYTEHMKARGRKARTIHNHKQPLNRALREWGDIYVASISHRHIDDLFAKADWSAATRNLYLGNIRQGFFPWCRRHGYMRKDFDPTDGWTTSRVERREKDWIPVDEFAGLLDAATSPRDRGVVAAGMFLMLRGSEVSYLKVGSVDFDHDRILVWREKTQEEDWMPMSVELKEELLVWFRHYELSTGRTPLHPDWFLFPAQGPLPMKHDHSIGKLQPTGEAPPYKPWTRLGKPYMAVKRTVKAYGIDDYRAGVHLLRRSSARAYYDLLVEQGHDHALMRVGAILGHKDTKTTQIYLGVKIEREQRNAAIAGKVMFPNMRKAGSVTELRKAL